MGSPSSTQEWLELSLGFRSSVTKKQKQEEEEKKVICGRSTTTTTCEDGLELRLDLMYHHHHQNYKFNHTTHHSYYNHNYYSINNNFGLSSSSPFPNSSPGLWFSLLSSSNRKGGAALPQIPKPYIRVKDGKMTVLMVKKYLVTKLGLSNEAEVELWCMGERLLQSQSLKQVRDGVWVPKLVDFVNNANSSSLSTSSSILIHQNQTTYLMSLHYGRTTCFF